MNRTIRNQLLSLTVVFVVLLIALIGLPGSASPSVGQAAFQSAVTRLPRPHPQSHLAITSAITLSPRPHPISHRSFPPGIDLLNPRPHPVSHIGLALNRP